MEADDKNEFTDSTTELVVPQCVDEEVSSSDGDEYCHADVKLTSIELQKGSPNSAFPVQ